MEFSRTDTDHGGGDTKALPDGAGADDFSDSSVTFGDRLTWARESLGLSQEELAQRLGVKHRTLRGWEEDRAEPRANRLNMLAGMMNVSIVWLLSGRGTPPGRAGRGGEEAVSGCLRELRLMRAEQERLGDRIVRIEERLRAALE